MTLEFFAQGLPKGQPRTKAFKRGNHAGVFDPGTANDWKAVVRTAASVAIPQGAPCPLFTGPVRLDATFYFPRPRSHYRGKSDVLRADAPVHHVGKPDRDNLDKAVLDTLTDLQVLKADEFVASGTITKLYAAPGQPAGARVHILRLADTH